MALDTDVRGGLLQGRRLPDYDRSLPHMIVVVVKGEAPTAASLSARFEKLHGYMPRYVLLGDGVFVVGPVEE